jgi:sugar phosphate isomerase/epimerase
MAEPEIGLSMLYCLNEPFSSMLQNIRKLDVKHVELSDEGLHALNKSRTKKLNELAKTLSLDYVVHAPWAGINIATPDKIVRRAVMKRLKSSIVLTGQLGCRLWLFHPGSFAGLEHFYPGKAWKQNLESVRSLLYVARQEGVNIALENTPEPFPFLMKNANDFHRFYEDLDDDIGMVLDVAHANINNQIQAFLGQFPKKIVHMHVSDNNGDSDMHLGIGHGNINWKNTAKTIKAANYGKLIMIESTQHVPESIKFLQELFS